MSLERFKKLALLTDADAEFCLNGLIKGLTIRSPEYARLLVTPGDMEDLIRQSASAVSGDELSTVGEVAPEERPKLIRMVLVEAAADSELGPKIDAWITGARPKLLEPVTTALVLAGIILVLSTHVKVEYEKDGDETNLKVTIEKKPTSESLLGKFFGIFK